MASEISARIIKGPSELDLAVALLRGDKAYFTFKKGTSYSPAVLCEVFIDALDALDHKKKYKKRNSWLIKGRFSADGVNSWKSWPGGHVWGEFTCKYNSRTRSGMLEPLHFTDKIPLKLRK